MAPNGIIEGVPKSDFKEENVKSERRSIQDTYDNKIMASQRQPLKWFNIVGIIVVHALGLWGLTVTLIASVPSVIFCTLWGVCGGLGVTAGAHRLWAHKTYQANLPFRLFLAACFSVAGQNTIPQWVLDHRVHHKFSETDADPHNSNRGFFFAHVGWLMQRKHPQVLLKGKSVDISDIYNDPVVRLHTKYFIELKMLMCFILPMIIPYYLWNELFYVCFFGNFLRYIIGLNVTWLVNSAAHIYGNHPYSREIRPAENPLVSFLTLGEGWHNYHHVFPWDYRAAELGGSGYNPTTIILDAMAAIGAVTHRKSPSKDLVIKVAQKYGDGSYDFGRDSHIPEVDENGSEVNGM